MQLSLPHCVTHKKLLLTYQTYAALQFFVRALFGLSHQSYRFIDLDWWGCPLRVEICIDRSTLNGK